MTQVVRARELIAKPVVTLGGDDVAEVRDVVYDSERGELLGAGARAVGYEVTGGESDDGTPRYVTLPEQRAVSGDALIVPDEVGRFVVDDLAGFGASVPEFRAQLHEEPDAGPDAGRVR